MPGAEVRSFRLFALPVPESRLAPLVPPPLEVDSLPGPREGWGLFCASAFELHLRLPLGISPAPITQLNYRIPVLEPGGRPALLFLGLVCASATLRLLYRAAGAPALAGRIDLKGDRVRAEHGGERLDLVVSAEDAPGPTSWGRLRDPSDWSVFLADRFAGFYVSSRGSLVRVAADHPPVAARWRRLERFEISLLERLGVAAAGRLPLPLLLSPGFPLRIGRPRSRR